MIELFTANPISTILGGVGGLLIGVLGQEYRFRRERRRRRREAAREWYQESLSIMSNVISFGERATRTVDFDFEKVDGHTSELSDRLIAHASGAPEAVDEESRGAVTAVGVLCLSASLLAQTGVDVSGRERYDKFLQWTKQESDLEMDYDEAIEQIESLVGDANSVFDESQRDIEVGDEQIDNAEIEDFAESFSEDDIESMEDLLQMLTTLSRFFDDEALDDIIQVAVLRYTRLFLVDYPQDVVEIVEQRSDLSR